MKLILTVQVLAGLSALPGAAADAERGRDLIVQWRCIECHGLSGNNRQATARPLPMIAGQSREFLTMRLEQYKSGLFREVDTSSDKAMSELAAAMSTEQIADITAWYASQKRY